MNVSAQMVKELRNKTSAGIMDCKEALRDSEGNIKKAIEYLRKKGINAASSKLNRQTLNGKIGSYIHLYGKIGVLVEVNCETDFVADTDNFKEFVKDITMQITASDPKYISREEVPKSIVEKERNIFIAQVEKTNKPAAVIEKIVAGKLEKYFKENCLLEQLFIKDNNKTVNELLLETIAKLGENISIKRFARFKLGEEI